MSILYTRIITSVVVVAIIAAGYIFIMRPFESYTPIASPEDTAQYYRTQANQYLENKEYQKALEVLLKLETLVPEDLAVHYSVAKLYQSSGKKAEARAALERGIPYLKDPQANEAYAKLLSELE
jgi:tetratricopeptide (TPR) repeat protein